jgi:nucleotide-binding universal stress UspA family protein
MALATQLQARLTLLHVLYLPSLFIAARLTSYLAEEEAEAQHALDACLQRVHNAGLAGTAVVVYGVPWTKIVETARTMQADLIVLGSHGRTGLSHMLLGSVAERVVRLAPCPVLVTRATAGGQ